MGTLVALVRTHLNFSIANGLLIADHKDKAIHEMLRSRVTHWQEVPPFRVARGLRFAAARTALLMVWENADELAGELRRNRSIRPYVALMQLAGAFAGAAALIEFGKENPRSWQRTILSGDESVMRIFLYEVSRQQGHPVYCYLAGRHGPKSASLDYDALFTPSLDAVPAFTTVPRTIVLAEFPSRQRSIEDVSQLEVGLVTDNYVSEPAWAKTIEELCAHPRIERVHVRLHPRSKLRLPRHHGPCRVKQSARSQPLQEFAEAVDFAITSGTSTAWILRGLGVPCFRLPALNPGWATLPEEPVIAEALHVFLTKLRRADLRQEAILADAELPTGVILRADASQAIAELLLP